MTVEIVSFDKDAPFQKKIIHILPESGWRYTHQFNTTRLGATRCNFCNHPLKYEHHLRFDPVWNPTIAAAHCISEPIYRISGIDCLERLVQQGAVSEIALVEARQHEKFRKEMIWKIPEVVAKLNINGIVSIHGKTISKTRWGWRTARGVYYRTPEQAVEIVLYPNFFQNIHCYYVIDPEDERIRLEKERAIEADRVRNERRRSDLQDHIDRLQLGDFKVYWRDDENLLLLNSFKIQSWKYKVGTVISKVRVINKYIGHDTTSFVLEYSDFLIVRNGRKFKKGASYATTRAVMDAILEWGS